MPRMHRRRAPLMPPQAIYWERARRGLADWAGQPCGLTRPACRSGLPAPEPPRHVARQACTAERTEATRHEGPRVAMPVVRRQNPCRVGLLRRARGYLALVPLSDTSQRPTCHADYSSRMPGTARCPPPRRGDAWRPRGTQRWWRSAAWAMPGKQLLVQWPCLRGRAARVRPRKACCLGR